MKAAKRLRWMLYSVRVPRLRLLLYLTAHNIHRSAWRPSFCNSL
jgi:hypothetical protein